MINLCNFCIYCQWNHSSRICYQWQALLHRLTVQDWRVKCKSLTGPAYQTLRGVQQDCQDHRNKVFKAAETVASGILIRWLQGRQMWEETRNYPASLQIIPNLLWNPEQSITSIRINTEKQCQSRYHLWSKLKLVIRLQKLIVNQSLTDLKNAFSSYVLKMESLLLTCLPLLERWSVTSMKTVTTSALKNILINEGLYLTTWVRRPTTQTKAKIKQKQIYTASSTIVEAARGKLNDLQLVSSCNFLKKHLRTHHSFMRNPPITTDTQEKKQYNSQFCLMCCLCFQWNFRICWFFELKISEDTAVKDFVTDFPEPS